jgi:hypothetical protein
MPMGADFEFLSMASAAGKGEAALHLPLTYLMLGTSREDGNDHAGARYQTADARDADND